MSVDVLAYLQSKGLDLKRSDATNIHTSCFFCNEDMGKRGRLYINVDEQAEIPGLFKCFLCDERGSLVTIKRHFGDPVGEKEEIGDEMFRIFKAAAAYYHDALADHDEAFAWLRGPKRGLSVETIVDAQLGYAEAGNGLFRALRGRGFSLKEIIATGLIREDKSTGKFVDSLQGMVTIPYFVAGNCVGIRGRAYPYDPESEQPKYKTCGGTKSRLFNTDVVWHTDELVITEGEFDALALGQIGVQAVGVPGARNWQEAWDGYLIDMRRLWIVFDPDKTGQDGAKKIKDRHGVRVKEVHLDNSGAPVDVTDWLTAGHSHEDFEVAKKAALVGGLLVTVDEALAEHLEIQGLEGLKFGNEELDHWIRPGLLVGQVMVVLAKSGTGKSHPVNSQVPTPEGFRRWGSLRPGDSVFGSNGMPTKVVAVHPQGVQPTYRVMFSDGTDTHASADHIWTVRYRYGRKREWHEKTMTTVEILESGLRAGHNNTEYKYSLPMCAPVEYPQRDLPIDPYVLGAVIANGSTTGTSAVLTTPDEFVVGLVRSNYPTRRIERASEGCPAYVLRGLIGAVRQLGLNVRSADKFIPAQYLLGSVQQRVALLNGLMDGDGSPSTQRKPNSSRYSTMSARLAADMVTLVTSLGGTASVSRSRRDGEYTLSVMLPHGIKPFRSARKAMAFDGVMMRRPHRAIKAIERVTDAESMCITVDAPDSLYLVGRNHVVTHNTIWLLNAMHQMRLVKGQENKRFLFVSLEQTRGEWWERARRIHRFYNLESNDKDALDFWRDHLLIIDKNRVTQEDLNSALDDYEYRMGGKPDCVFVDYLGYWARGFKGEGYQRTSDAVMALKEIAKERRIPIIAPHQVSRVAKYGEEPDADAARDSGVIEETADFLFILWTQDAQQGRTEEEKSGVVHMKIGKSRHGGRGVKLDYQFAPISLTLVPYVNTVDSKLLQRARDELRYEREYHDKWEQAVYRHLTGMEGHLEPNPGLQRKLV